jgi:hypothetical protein
VTLAAGDRAGLHVLMTAYALLVEGIFQRRQRIIGLLFVTGIARLPLSSPVIQECVKIMMAPAAVQLVFGVKVVIELDQRPLVCADLPMIEEDGIFLGMSQRDENGKSKENQQNF